MLKVQDRNLAEGTNECEQLVLTYESLAHQIATLLQVNCGMTRNMSDEDYALYRRLAYHRDLVCHMIQVLEYSLLDD